MISAVLYDLGGTLHTIEKLDATRLRYCERLIERLDDYGIRLDVSPDELSRLLSVNAEAYKEASEESLMELPPARIWNEYYLKEFCIGEERLADIAEELSFRYDYERVKNLRRPGLYQTVCAIDAMGIKQGVISNIISASLVPHMLTEYGILGYMQTILTSCETGIRKPDPRIFELACEQLHITPAEMAYVGDTVSRDVIGAKRANAGLMILIRNPSIAYRDRKALNTPYKPDVVIDALDEIPEIINRFNGGTPC